MLLPRPHKLRMDPKYYTEHPGYFSEAPFDEVLEELQPLFGTNVVYGYQISRLSCKFVEPGTDKHPVLKSYGNAKIYPFSKSPWIEYFREELEKLTKVKYDYVLVHLYPTGESSIGFHSDSEALHSSVASISLGATRRMKFRKLGETKGCLQEFSLAHGDLLIMEEGCQRKYVHQIPKEKKVKEPRINMTWRVYED